MSKQYVKVLIARRQHDAPDQWGTLSNELEVESDQTLAICIHRCWPDGVPPKDVDSDGFIEREPMIVIAPGRLSGAATIGHSRMPLYSLLSAMWRTTERIADRALQTLASWRSDFGGQDIDDAVDRIVEANLRAVSWPARKGKLRGWWSNGRGRCW